MLCSSNSSAAYKEGIIYLKVSYDKDWQRKVVVEHITAGRGIVF